MDTRTHGGKSLNDIQKIIDETVEKSKGELDMLKTYDQNPDIIKNIVNPDVLKLLTDLIPKSTEGKIVASALIALVGYALLKGK